MTRLFYYAHRYRDPDRAIQAANLSKAKAGFDFLRQDFNARGIRLWAPWFALADAGIDEETCWLVIDRCVRVCHGIVLDLDGTREPSPGMLRERDIMLSVGGAVEVVR